jgi:aminocarboxymuconate-semialdehyde decarboxylase
MHPEDVAGSEKMGPYGLRLICGNPADSALSLGFMTYSGVFDRFPNLKLCVLHGGGFFPYHLGRFDQGWAVRSGARAAQAKKPPSGYLNNIYYDDMIYRVDTIDYLRKLAGADHIMVGTDYPFTLGDWKAVEKIEALDCSDSEKELMLEGNAKRLLKL